jgi:methionine-rich copper-binding protein CopC
MLRPLFCALALLAIAPAQALAHAQLVKAEPKVGSTIEAPARLWLRFNEVPRLPGSGMELTGPDGKLVSLGATAKDPSDPRAIAASLPARLPAGRYHVQWKALSPDAHHTQGSFNFTVRP